MELSYIQANNIIPRKCALHDCASNATALTIATTDGWVEYVNNKLAYEYKNGSDLWDSINNIVKDTIVDSKIDIVLNSTLLATANASFIAVKLVIPHPDGDISVSIKTIPIVKKSIAIDETFTFNVYNGIDANLYGFKMYTMVEGGDIAISNRRILIRV